VHDASLVLTTATVVTLVSFAVTIMLRRRSRARHRRKTPSSHPSLASRLTVWFVCSFLAAVIPLAFVWYARAQESPRPPKITDVLATGDLIIISLVLIIGALGELYLATIGRTFTQWHGVNMIGGGISLFAGGLIYANNYRFNCDASHIHTQHPDWVAWTSVAVFILAFIVGAGSIGLGSRKGAE
jgi:hypothetical protein